MDKNIVMSYDEFVLESKINQGLSNGAPASGTKVTKAVDPKTTPIPVKGGSVPKKVVEPKMAKMPEGKGKTPKSSVKTGTTTLPTKKGSVPSKMVKDNANVNLNVKGSTSGKTVNPTMATLPIGKVTPNSAVNKVYGAVKDAKPMRK